MLHKVQGIILQYVTKHRFHTIQIFLYHLHSHCRHSTRNAIGGKGLRETVEKHIRKWFQTIYRHIILIESGITLFQKLRKSNRIHVHVIHLSHWKRKSLMPKSQPLERTGTSHSILGGLFAEIFHGTNGFRTILYLIKDKQSLLRQD